MTETVALYPHEIELHFRIMVDYERSLSGAIQAGHYDHVEKKRKICENFPPNKAEAGHKELECCLYHFLNGDKEANQFMAQLEPYGRRGRYPSPMLRELVTCFFNGATAVEAIDQINRDARRPGTLRELLAVGKAYPEFQRQYAITALGSVWSDAGGSRFVTSLAGDSAKRTLVLPEFDGHFGDSHRFLAVASAPQAD